MTTSSHAREQRPSPRRASPAVATRVVTALVAAAAVSSCAEPSSSRSPESCGSIVVEPGPDVTAALQAALVMASATHVPGVVGARGGPQGRVYLRAGEYGLRTVSIPDDVRVEIDPGATLHPVEGFDPNPSNDWGLFVFGDASAPTSNVTIAAGDGCGGAGHATPSNKPRNTNFRGNDPNHGGMANAPVPFRREWHTSRMWVMDLDPDEYASGVQVTGFWFRWAYDIDVSDVLTIQNAARSEVGIGVVDGSTSRTTAMMFDPPNDTTYSADPSQQKIPHAVRVFRHYNILSPSGQGPNQIRACADCEFHDVFSHGGVALRVETDGIRTLGADCSSTGAQGAGFREFAIVNNLVASGIEGAYGNRVVMFTPHCLPNGTASVSGVRGTSMGELVAVANAQSDAPNGRFERIHIEDVWGCSGELAQEPYPMDPYNSYLPAASRSAVTIAATWVELTGVWRWPPLGASGGLADGPHPATPALTVTPTGSCP